MLAFKPANKAPGVYIEEVQLPGPIQGVATSVAAFVGPARMGPMNQPSLITNWTQFVAKFGTSDPKDANGPYITGATPVYVTHAVRGFFDNGGTVMYFVRVGVAQQAQITLVDGAGKPAVVVTAVASGVAGNQIKVEVKAASIATTNATRPAAAALAAAAQAKDTAITLSAADAATFSPGDLVFISEQALNDTAVITSIANGKLSLDHGLANAYTVAAKVRLADFGGAGSTQLTFRVDKVAGIQAGSVITLTQGGTTDTATVSSVSATTSTITLSAVPTKSFSMDSTQPALAIKTNEFSLTFTIPGITGTTVFDNLSMDPRHTRYFTKVVSLNAVTVAPTVPPTPTPPPNNIPIAVAVNLANGTDENYANIGAPQYKAAIDTLNRVDDVNLLCVPDRTDLDIQKYMIAHCENKQDRFPILDPMPGATPDSDPNTGILTQRGALGSDAGFGALYYPRIQIGDPITGDLLTIPPSGHLAGMFGRVDNNPGVHKAPANEQLLNALDLETRVTADEQGPLNEQQVNCIRSFKGRGILAYGARTLSLSTQWRYVSTRRLITFIEQSLIQGTQFVVFQPNEPALWHQVSQVVSEFLTRVWNSGALIGDTPDQGFAVKVDAELNPPAQMALGILAIQVTVYPAPPAEYVVFQIIQQPGGPVIVE